MSSAISPVAPTRRAAVLGRYRDPGGASRELVALPAAHGSLLVVDREPPGGDRRLVARIEADEPAGNAAIAAQVYLEADPAERRCRALADADVTGVSPVAFVARGGRNEEGAEPHAVSARGCELRLAPMRGAMSIPSLRWARRASGAPEAWHAVSLREAIAAIESYEPLREMTRVALERHEGDPTISTTLLRTELGRVLDSPIVLNRRLREAVLARVSRGEASLSEIAMRCGRLKHDPRGRTTGETSWLARRVGLLPEGGQRAPTRWVHSDVLALIARQGLGVAPREVELG